MEEDPFPVHQRDLFLRPEWRTRDKLLPDTKQQVKEISLISEGQHNSVLRREDNLLTQVQENLSISAGGGGGREGLGKGRVSGCFPRRRIGRSKLRGRQPRWTRASPLEGHSRPHNALRGASLGAAGPCATGTARPLFQLPQGLPELCLAVCAAFGVHLGLTGSVRAGAWWWWPQSLEGRVCGVRVPAI